MRLKECKDVRCSANRQIRFQPKQNGAALIVCLLMMLATLMLATSAAQIAAQEEKASRNERDRLIALQAAEAALKDAELDIERSGRGELFVQRKGAPVAGKCEEEIGNPLLGMCHPASPDAFPVWRRIDLAQGAAVSSVPYGYFTGNAIPIGGSWATAAPPRYLIEVLAIPAKDKEKSEADVSQMYRITALGYGSNNSIQVLLQIYYRKSGTNTDGLKTGRLAWREILNWEELQGEPEQD
ncbi:MAG TPA: PilX N-terminal domain-containing pilus assembly protein [Noviherbaspirillum sp.]|nr:PilX N-terminal domain-containing pilus assembly protein [Noviherbaspirillum sp.]